MVYDPLSIHDDLSSIVHGLSSIVRASRDAMQQDLDRELTRLIRRSPVLDRKLKEYWLRVLPHLAETEKARLWSTLRRADDDLRAGDHSGEL